MKIKGIVYKFAPFHNAPIEGGRSVCSKCARFGALVHRVDQLWQKNTPRVSNLFWRRGEGGECHHKLIIHFVNISVAV